MLHVSGLYHNQMRHPLQSRLSQDTLQKPQNKQRRQFLLPKKSNFVKRYGQIRFTIIKGRILKHWGC